MLVGAGLEHVVAGVGSEREGHVLRSGGAPGHVGGREVAAGRRHAALLPAELHVATDAHARLDLPLPGQLRHRHRDLLELRVRRSEQLGDVDRALGRGHAVVAEEEALAVQQRVLAQPPVDLAVVAEVGMPEHERVQQVDLLTGDLARVAGELVVRCLSVDRIVGGVRGAVVGRVVPARGADAHPRCCVGRPHRIRDSRSKRSDTNPRLRKFWSPAFRLIAWAPPALLNESVNAASAFFSRSMVPSLTVLSNRHVPVGAAGIDLDGVRLAGRERGDGQACGSPATEWSHVLSPFVIV